MNARAGTEVLQQLECKVLKALTQWQVLCLQAYAFWVVVGIGMVAVLSSYFRESTSNKYVYHTLVRGMKMNTKGVSKCRLAK